MNRGSFRHVIYLSGHNQHHHCIMTASECTICPSHMQYMPQGTGLKWSALQYIPIRKAMEDEGTRLGSIAHMAETP